MSELIHHGEWVVVCDGAKALVLENAGDAKFPNLKTIKVFEQKDMATHEIGADAPGRAFSPAESPLPPFPRIPYSVKPQALLKFKDYERGIGRS